jgi:hypothetical protein
MSGLFLSAGCSNAHSAPTLAGLDEAEQAYRTISRTGLGEERSVGLEPGELVGADFGMR